MQGSQWLRRTVALAVLDCVTSEKHDSVDSCMADEYPKKREHIEVLFTDLCEAGSMKMIENGPLYDDEGFRLWGLHRGSATINEIEIDVGIMFEARPNEAIRNKLLFDTIVHEKIHFEDWSDNKVHDMKHEVVAKDAADILKELKEFLLGPSIDWSQKKEVFLVL